MNDITTSATTSASPQTNKANPGLSSKTYATHSISKTPLWWLAA